MNQLDLDIKQALKIEDKAQRMTALYAVADQLDEQIPFCLAKQIEVYSHILGCVSWLQASAQYDLGYAEAERKKVYGMTLATAEGSAKEREGKAEIAAYEHRQKEAECAAYLTQWKHMFYSLQELINAKKQTLHVLNRELNNGSGTGR